MKFIGNVGGRIGILFIYYIFLIVGFSIFKNWLIFLFFFWIPRMMHHQWNLVVTVFLGSRVFRVPFMAGSFNFYGFQISMCYL